MANRSLGSVTTIMKLNNSAFKKGLNNSKKDVNKFSSSMKNVGASIAGAFAVRSIVRFGLESSKLASTMEGVAKAFDRIKPNINFLEQLKTATAGTVSELDLMRRAVMASNFKIPLTELSSLLKFATKRAQETGESVEYLVNSIVIGIGRKSPLILDNLGISAVELRKKLEGVGHSGATVGQVAAAVGEIATEAMAEMGDVIETTAIRYERMAASITNMKVEFGGLVNVIVVELLPPLIKAVEKMGDLVTIVKKGRKGFEWEQNLEQVNNATAKHLEETKKQILFSGPLHAEKNKTEDIVEIYKQIAQRIKEAEVNVKKFYEAGDEWASYGWKEFADGMRDWQKELERGTEDVKKSEGSLTALRAELKLTKEMFEATGDLVNQLNLANKMEEIAKQIKAIESIGKDHEILGDDEYFESVAKALNEIATQGEKIKQAGGIWGYLYANDEPEDIAGGEEWEQIADMWKMNLSQLMNLVNDPETNPFLKLAASSNILKIQIAQLKDEIAQNLVGAVYKLGEALGKSFSDMGASLKALGLEIARNIGYILMMAGLEMLKGGSVAAAAGAGLILTGGLLQLGSGIIGGFGNGGANVPSSSVIGSQGNVQFQISGQNLVGVLNRQNNRMDRFT